MKYKFLDTFFTIMSVYNCHFKHCYNLKPSTILLSMCILLRCSFIYWNFYADLKCFDPVSTVGSHNQFSWKTNITNDHQFRRKWPTDKSHMISDVRDQFSRRNNSSTEGQTNDLLIIMSLLSERKYTLITHCIANWSKVHPSLSQCVLLFQLSFIYEILLYL